jgi:Tfp pilus assembly protein FimV
MADVRQAVLEFDAAVQVPWRPLLRAEGALRAGCPAPSSAGRGLPGSGPRVAGHLRPVGDRSAASSAPRTAGPATVRPRPRRDTARPGGRPPGSAAAALPVRVGCTHEAAPLRLTRRGRHLLAALGAALAVGATAVVHGALDADPGGDLRLAGGSSVVVEAGDTVWSIAAEVAGPDEDVRVVVDAIEALNDLDDAVVTPGQVLELP